MAKRFADTEIWNKDWFLELSIKQKLLLKYIFDNCDCAGVYEISYRNLKNCFDEEVTLEDFKGLKQVKFIGKNKVFIEDFIEFQYGVKISELNPKNNIHRGILKCLTKHKFIKPFPNPLQTLMDKDMDKDKDKVMDKDIKKDIDRIKNNTNIHNNNIKTNNETDLYIGHSNLKSYALRTYQAKCKNLIPITTEPRSKRITRKIDDFWAEISFEKDIFDKLCQKANDLRIIANKQIDFEMMLNCYIGILNGKYETRTQKVAQQIQQKSEKIIEETSKRNQETRNFKGDPMPESFKNLGKKLRGQS